jgi:APA family basic amino acid/polyamine antiporter
MDPAPPTASDPSRLPRHLGVWNGALLLVTYTIGVGILQSPGVVLRNTGSVSLGYTAWLVGAVVAVCGALVMAELAARTPRSGGTTVFLREAYGPRAAFVYGWTALFLAPLATAAITLVSVRNLGAILGWSAGVQTAVGVSWVGGITLLAMRSGRWVAGIVGGVGIFKVSALGTVVVLCFAGEGAAAPGVAATGLPVPDSLWVGFGLAVVATMFAYDGWDGLALVAGEVRDPARNLPRATLLGMGIILAVYLAVNTGFLQALSPAQVATSPALAATAMERVLGADASRVVTVFVACSAASTVFSSLLCNPRIFFALAEEGQFFRVAARVHPTWATPWVATLAYGGLTVTYIASGGGFETLTRYMVLGFLPIYGLVAFAAILARRRGRPAVFAMPFYPWPVILMLVYVVAGLASGFAGDAAAAAGGLCLMAAGVGVHALWSRASGPTRT